VQPQANHSEVIYSQSDNEEGYLMYAELCTDTGIAKLMFICELKNSDILQEMLYPYSEFTD